MKLRIILVVLISTSCSSTFSQKLGNGLMNIYKGVGMISYLPKPNQRTYGTGTLIYKRITDTTLSVYLVTCKHVLPQKKDADYIYFDIANPKSVNKFSTIKISIYDTSGIYFPQVKIDPDGNDLAVIDVTNYFAQPHLRDIVNTIIPDEMILTKDSVISNNINVGDDVFFIGIPSGMYDNRNISPILRAGVISTPPESDFYFNDMIKAGYFVKYREIIPNKLNGFLIDGNAIGGSSGSLVFLKPQFIRIKNGQLEYNKEGGEPLILGILAFSYLDLGPTVDPIKINLGGVISGSSINKTIDLFKSK
jgi:hypothetical protein